MYSVAGDYDYLELITNSKSGSFFFYSHDQQYIIKNMKACSYHAGLELRDEFAQFTQWYRPTDLKRPGHHSW